jgi:hypothetical protein
MKLILFKLGILFFLQNKVTAFKIVPLGSYIATEVLFPLCAAVLEGFGWNTFQLVGYPLLDIIQSTKMAHFKVALKPGE